MNAQPEASSQHSWADLLSGLFAAAALFFSLIALAYHPVPVGVTAIALSLLAVGMSARHQRLAAAALAVSGACFVVGMSLAIITDNPLW